VTEAPAEATTPKKRTTRKAAAPAEADAVEVAPEAAAPKKRSTRKPASATAEG
jgi:hypothetical protein